MPSLLNPSARWFGSEFGTKLGHVIVPGSRLAAFVRSTGVQSDEDPYVAANLVPTLAAGLARCRSGQNDVVAVLPNHAETFGTGNPFAGLVAGTQIVGLGDPLCSNAPTLTWAHADASALLNVADVAISGMILNLGGADGVAKAINITAAGCALRRNQIITASSGALDAVIGIEVGTGAHRTRFVDNDFLGTTDGGTTDVIKVVAAVNYLRIVGNRADVQGATTGIFNIGAVGALRMYIADNDLMNNKAASTACISIGNAVSTGLICRNTFGVLADGVASTSGITFGATSLVRAFQNFCSDEALKSGVLSPVVVVN